MFFVQPLIDAISLGSLYALAALGIGLIFGVMRLINFAHGELIMIGGYSMYVLADWPLPVALIATVLIVIVAALLMERLAFRPLRTAPPATLLIASFALSFGVQNVARLIFGSLPKTLVVNRSLTRSFEIGGVRVARLSVMIVAVTLILLAALVVFLKRSSLGVQMRAAADDFAMARMLGVSANRTIAVAFALSGVLAAAVAVMVVAQTGGVSPGLGLNIVLLALIGTVIGGMDRLPGAALGGFAVGCTVSLLNAYLPLGMRSFRDAWVVAAVVVVLLVRPQGLLPGGTMDERV